MIRGHYTLPLKYCRKKAHLECPFAPPELILEQAENNHLKELKRFNRGSQS